ncbi:MAG: O-antigen ligase family protein [Oscillospiraceae bacterium]|nr:O-antigen ligase family protein [Oscillospiraceae bacterium]
MNELLKTSLLWRTVAALSAWIGRSPVGRASAALGRLWRQSAIYGLFARLLCADSHAARSKTAGFFDRINAGLCRLGQRLMPAVRESLLYRVYAWIMRKGRESVLLGWLFAGGMTAILLTLIASYALLDWLLRDVLTLGAISSVWDEALMLVCLAWIVMRRINTDRPLRSAFTSTDVYLIFYLLVGAALLSLTSRFWDINITGFRASMQYILIFFLVTRLLRDERDLRLMYDVMVVLAFAFALYGIWQFVIGVEIPETWQDRAETAVRTRVFSIFANPNIMAAYMLLFAPMAIGRAYTCRTPAAQTFFWFAGICMCVACLFTMTRAAWMALAIAAVLFALIVDRRLFALMLLAGIAACFLPFVRSRIGYLFTPQFQESNARAGRGKRWETAFGYLDETYAWGTGLGYGMFGGAVAAQNPINPDYNYMYVDNYYVKILVENGIAGLAAFLTSALGLLVNGVRSVARSSRTGDKPLCAGMFCGLVAILIHSFFESLWEEPYMMALFFAVAGMLVFAGFLKREEKTV